MREIVARSLPTNGGDNDKDGSYTDYNWGALPAQAGMIPVEFSILSAPHSHGV